MWINAVEREKFVKSKGGVSVLALIISIAVYVALYAMIGLSSM